MKKAAVVTLLLAFVAFVAIANINKQTENKTEKKIEKKTEKKRECRRTCLFS
jgi:large-conductance mechanosensitive channel